MHREDYKAETVIMISIHHKKQEKASQNLWLDGDDVKAAVVHKINPDSSQAILPATATATEGGRFVMVVMLTCCTCHLCWAQVVV